MAEINYINGYEIADAKSRGDASEALSKSNSNSESISDLNAEIVLEKSTRQSTDANLQTQINSLASGSPKDVYATVAALEAANPDTGVYIVSADGHIYSWTKNGTDATDLGVYQATSVDDDSITMAMLKDEVKDNMFTGNLAYKDLVPGFIDPWGVLQNQTVNDEYTTPIIDLSNDKYVKVNASYSNVSLSWVAISFFDANEQFIKRDTFAPVTNGRTIYMNKTSTARYCRLSYRRNTLEHIYFTTNSRSNINSSIISENFDGYTLMYEGKPTLKSKELIENTNLYKMTYKLPAKCGVYLKSKYVADLSNKEFFINQDSDYGITTTAQRYYIYYDYANNEIKYRNVIANNWDNTEISEEYRKYILIGFVNNQYGIIELYGNNFDIQYQDKLCGIVNGLDDNSLPRVESNHFKLANDTILVINHKIYDEANQIILTNGIDVDISNVESTAIKICYLKMLNKAVAVAYNAKYYTEDGINYYLDSDDTILIAIIRKPQKMISINSPYIYDRKLFGLDIKDYIYLKNGLTMNSRIGTAVTTTLRNNCIVFFISDKLPKNTKFKFNGSDTIYQWAVTEIKSESIPDYTLEYSIDFYQNDSGYLHYHDEYIAKYNGYKAVVLSYRDTTKNMESDKNFYDYFTVTTPSETYEDSILKEINNINLDKKINLNLYPSRQGSKGSKNTVSRRSLIIDNKIPKGSVIKFKELEGKDYDWAVVETSDTFPYGSCTIYDSGWRNKNAGDYITLNDAYIFLTLRKNGDIAFTSDEYGDIYNSFEVIPNNQINNLENIIENINYDENRTKLIDVNKNIKAINHRGYNTIAPENTLPAYKLSKQKGFFYVETDVSFTSDGIPVCLHDNTINRTARNADGSTISETININDITFADVREYDFGIWKSSAYAGTQIPSLEEFLTLCKNIGLHPYIELKSSATYSEAQIQSLVDMVKRLGMEGKVTWISFNSTYLTYVKNYDSKARLGFLAFEFSTYIINLAAGLKTQYNDIFMNVRYDAVNNTTVNQCIAAGLPIEVWSINNENTILGLDPYITGVTSDNLIAGEVLYNNNIE